MPSRIDPSWRAISSTPTSCGSGSTRIGRSTKESVRESTCFRRKGLRPEQLVDPTTAKELDIQENDLWLAAQALEHNLVLVSHDKMTRLRKVAEELRVQDWAKEP